MILRRADQIIAQLDQNMGATRGDRMAVKGIALKRACIGLIFADAEVRFRLQAGDERARQPLIRGIENAHMPRPGRTAAKLRCETVDRDDDRVLFARGELGQSGVIGPVTCVQAALPLRGVGAGVAGDEGAVIELGQT